MIQNLMTSDGSPAGSLLVALNHLCFGHIRTWPSTYQADSLWNENGTKKLRKMFESV